MLEERHDVMVVVHNNRPNGFFDNLRLGIVGPEPSTGQVVAEFLVKIYCQEGYETPMLPRDCIKAFCYARLHGPSGRRRPRSGRSPRKNAAVVHENDEADPVKDKQTNNESKHYYHKG